MTVVQAPRTERISRLSMRRPLGDHVISAIVLGALLLTIAPLYYLVRGALLTGRPGATDARLTLDGFPAVFGSTKYVGPLMHTLAFGVVIATTTTMVVGTVCWAATRTDLPGKRALVWLAPATLAIGPVVGAMAWIALLSPRGVGFLNHFSEGPLGRDVLNIYSFPGVVLVLTFVQAPMAFLFMYGGFANLASDQEEAARVHGASIGRLFRSISLPAARSTLLGAWVLLFGMAIQNVSVYALVASRAGVSTVSADMYRIVTQGRAPANEANVLALFIILPSLAVLVLHIWYTKRLGMQRVLGRQTGGPGVRLGAWKYPLLAAVAGYLVVLVLLPIAALLYSSFQKYRTSEIDTSLFTVDHYREIFEAGSIRDSLFTSLKLSVCVATIGTSVSFLFAYVSMRRRGILGALVGVGPVLMLTVPGFALGIGFLWASFSNSQIRDWSATVIGLSIAVMLAYVGFGARVFSSALNQFGTAYEEAAIIAGKSTWTRLRRVLAPLLLPSIVSVWRMLAVLGLLEFNIVALLYQGGAVPISVYMFTVMEIQPAAGVFASGVLQVALVGIILAVTLLPGRKMRRVS